MPNINVRLEDDIYGLLQSLKVRSGCRNWVEFLTKIASGEVEINIEFLEIDSESPTKHEVIFRLGDFIYKFKEGDFTPIKTPVTQFKVTQALKAMKGLKFG